MTDLIYVALSSFAVADQRPLELLKQSGLPYRIYDGGKRITPKELIALAPDAKVVIAGVEPYDAAALASLPALKCISRCGVGVDAIDLAAARAAGVSVANTPDIPAVAVAELALAMYLSLSRNFRAQTTSMAARKWERLTTHLLAGRTIGLIGAGRIGRRVAKLCKVFDADVIACDPFADAAELAKEGIRAVSFDDLLATADIVSLHAAKSKDAPIRIGEQQIARMKDGAILVNLARGDMIDEAALLAALTSGKLLGAGLDVFGEEPYAGPLCGHEQVILTPHSATNTVETRSAMEVQCVENAIAFLTGEIPRDRRVI